MGYGGGWDTSGRPKAQLLNLGATHISCPWPLHRHLLQMACSCSHTQSLARSPVCSLILHI